jgi:hypothetical protein
MTITNYDGIIASRSAGKGDDIYFQKTGTVGGVTATWYTYMKAAGMPGAATYANASAAGSMQTATMTGSIPLGNATAGDSKYLLTFAGCIPTGAEISVLGLVDVLWAGAGIQVNSSATVTVNSPSTLRSTAWRNHRLGVFCATAITTASTMTVWYTDAGGTATSIDVVLGVVAANRMLPIGNQFVSLPNGIQTIQSVQVQTAQTNGAVDIFICKPLVYIPTIALNTWVERDVTAQIDGIVKLDLDSSYAPGFMCLVALTNGTTARGCVGMIRTCAG